MIPRMFLSLLLVSCLVDRGQTDMMAWAAEPHAGTYSLDDIVALAVERSPTMAGAQGFVKQSHGQQIAAGGIPQSIGLRHSWPRRHS